MKQINIWGIKINPLSKSDIVQLIDEHLSSNRTPFHLTGVNPETIVQSQNNESLRLSINSSDLVNIDNMLVLIFLRSFHKPSKHRLVLERNSFVLHRIGLNRNLVPLSP